MADLPVFVITSAGRAKLPNASGTGTAAVTIAQIGVSSTAVTALASMTALPDELKRLNTFGGSAVASDTLHLNIRDESADAYILRSLALYLNDGTLFGLYGQADAIMEKAAASLLLLSTDIKFADIAATDITFGSAEFLNPPSTETVQGVLALATQAEVTAGAVANKAVTPKTLLIAFTAWVAAQLSDVWKASNDGSGSGLDADLLDGQHGAYYANIPARLGYTPANLAGDTFAGPIRRDPNFYLELQSGNPIVNFDPNDYILYDRANNQVNFVINATVRGYLTSSGVFYASGGFSAGGNTVWHAGNDGAGSGVDADLLDGQHGSYYLAASAYTAADVKAKMLTVDGSGSGLDADLLDGQDSGYYTAITARLGYTPVQQGGGSGQGTNKIYIGWSGSRVKVQVDGSDMGNVVFDGNVSDVWRASNDGAGSGLDADLLDGQDSSFYTNIPGRLGYTPLNSGSYTAGDVLAKMVSVDGSGSGLDSDLLDGQHGGFYTDIPGRLGFNPLNSASYTAGDVLAKMVSVDGSGSGLDADLLDGYQAAAFALAGLTNAVLPAGSNGNGTWFKIGNLIIQCGMRATIAPDTTATVTYPLAMTNAPFFFIAGTRISGFDTGADSFAQIIGTPGTASMTVANQRANNSATIDVPWLIIAWA